MISNELLEEVINISQKKRYISKGLLLRIALNVIENLDSKTKSRLQEIKFVDSDWEFALASCDRKRGIIEVDYTRLLQQEKNLNPLSYLKANLSIIQYLLHEIEHLNEHFKSKQNDLQAKIINICSGEFIHKSFQNKVKDWPYHKRIEYANKKFREFCEDNWAIIPIEKIAEADSINNILNSIKAYPNFTYQHSETYFSILIKYIKSLKLGYEFNEQTGSYNIPLIDYLSALNSKIDLKDIGLVLKPSSNNSNKLISELSIEERMKLGLPITSKDIKELNKQKIMLRSTK